MYDQGIAALSGAISDSLVNSKSFDDISTKLYTFARHYDSRFIWHINVGLKGFTNLNTVDHNYVIASVGDILVKIESIMKNNTHHTHDIKLH